MKTTTAAPSPVSATADWRWLHDVIGKPWVFGEAGPASFDCWGLLVYIYKVHLGVDLPRYPSAKLRDPSNARLIRRGIRTDWTELTHPEAWCGVGLSASGIIHHVGIWLDIDGGRVLHAMDRGNVVLQSLSSLKNQWFPQVTFYRYDPSSQRRPSRSD